MPIKDGQTATNAQGEKVVYRGGVWQPLVGPQPVKLPPQEETQMGDLRGQAVSMGQTDQQLQRFVNLNKNVATGPGHTEALFPFTGIDLNPANWFKNADTQEMESIAARVAPKQRVQGSGSSSDKDVALFMKGIPSLTNWGRTNANIADDFHNQTVQSQARVKFYDDWVQQHGTLNGASAAFQQKLDEIAAAPQSVAHGLVAKLTGAPGPMPAPAAVAAPVVQNRVQAALAAKPAPVAPAPKKKLVWDPVTGGFK